MKRRVNLAALAWWCGAAAFMCGGVTLAVSVGDPIIPLGERVYIGAFGAVVAYLMLTGIVAAFMHTVFGK